MKLLDLIEPVLKEFPQIFITKKDAGIWGYKIGDFGDIEAIGNYNGIWLLSIETTKIHVHVIPKRGGIEIEHDLWHETIDITRPNTELIETLRKLICLGITKVHERGSF